MAQADADRRVAEGRVDRARERDAAQLALGQPLAALDQGAGPEGGGRGEQHDGQRRGDRQGVDGVLVRGVPEGENY
jgi:hypothetical protein